MNYKKLLIIICILSIKEKVYNDIEKHTLKMIRKDIELQRKKAVSLGQIKFKKNYTQKIIRQQIKSEIKYL